MAGNNPTTSKAAQFHTAFDTVMLHAMLTVQEKPEMPTVKGCLAVLEQHGQRWMDRYLKNASLVRYPEVGWRRVFKSEAAISSSKDMEEAILKSLKDICIVQPKGATLDGLWDFFQATFRMPETLEALQLLKEKLACGVDSMKTWDKITVKEGFYSLAVTSESPADPAASTPAVFPTPQSPTENVAVKRAQTASVVNQQSPSTAPTFSTVSSAFTNGAAPLRGPEQQVARPVVAVTAGNHHATRSPMEGDAPHAKRPRVDPLTTPVGGTKKVSSNLTSAPVMNMVTSVGTQSKRSASEQRIRKSFSDQVAARMQNSDLPTVAPLVESQLAVTETPLRTESGASFHLQSVPKTRLGSPVKSSFTVPEPSAAVKYCNEWVPLLDGKNGNQKAEQTLATTNPNPGCSAVTLPVQDSIRPPVLTYDPSWTINQPYYAIKHQFWLAVDKARVAGILSDEGVKAVQYYVQREPVEGLLEYKNAVLDKRDKGQAVRKIRLVPSNSEQWSTALGIVFLVWQDEMMEFAAQVRSDFNDEIKMHLHSRAVKTLMVWWGKAQKWIAQEVTQTPAQ